MGAVRGATLRNSERAIVADLLEAILIIPVRVLSRWLPVRTAEFGGSKKERRPKPPLRRRALKLRLRKTAVFLGLSNFVRFLRALRLDPGRGPATSAFFIDVSRPSSFPGLRPFRRQTPELRSIRLVGPSGSRLSDPGSFAAEAAIEPDLSQPELRPVCRPVEARASWRLSRGIAFPSRVTL